MTTIDLPVVSARIAERADILGIAEDAGCDPEWLAGVLVTATAEVVEAAVRAQVAAEIQARVHPWHPSPTYLDGLRYAASIARGES